MKHGRSPYTVLIRRHVTEKATVLQGLEHSESNPSVARCNSPKVVFVVHPDANKREVASAVESVYQDRKVRVAAVNMITVKPKKRRVRGRTGMRAGFKKAIVTLEAGDALEEV